MSEQLLTRHEGDAFFLTLSRPEVGNCLSATLVEDLHHGLDRFEDSSAKVVVFQGEGRHFCTGFDLTDIAGCNRVSNSMAMRPERWIDRCNERPLIRIGQIDELPRFRRADRHRLLEQHMKPAVERFFRMLVMKVVRSGDDNGIQLALVEHRAPIDKRSLGVKMVR